MNKHIRDKINALQSQLTDLKRPKLGRNYFDLTRIQYLEGKLKDLKAMKEIEISLEGVPLLVEYKISGRYIPATREDPEEWPELELLSIKVVDSRFDITELLVDSYIDHIHEKIWEENE